MARQGEGKLDNLAIGRATKRGLYSDGHGLYLQVSPTGTKSWVFQYRLPKEPGQKWGRLRVMGLGSLHTIGLAKARQRARECREQRLEQVDPISAREAARTAARLEAAKAMTFRQCAVAYIVAHEAGWKNAVHAKQWPSTLATYVYPVFGDLPVAAIDTGLVMKVIEPIWTTKTETASRLRGRIEAVLDWAKVRGYRDRENPARWKGHLDQALPERGKVAKVEHHAALPYTQIAAFMGELRQQSSISSLALQFAILTAARTGEVIGMTWDEVDLDNDLWTVPAGRMKADREHRVPLSEPAMAVLRQLHQARTGDHVFFGAKPNTPLSNMAMLALLRRMGRGDLTTHGFRSTFRDWAAETGQPSDVAEAALAHTLGSKVQAAYQRGDLLERRRRLMDTWGAACAGQPVGNVVPTQREVA